MNKYIISLLLVATLIFCVPANAATFTATINVTNGGGGRMYLKEIYTPSWVEAGGQASPVGSYCVAVYEATVTPYLTLSQDSYITGLIRSYVALSPTIPTGYTLDSINFNFDPNNSLTAYSGIYNYVSQGYCYIQSIFDNAFIYNYSPGNITFTVSISYQEAQSDEPPEYISFNPTCSIVSNMASAHQVIQEYGLNAQIEQALEHAQIQGFDDIVTVLNLIKSQDNSQYINLLTALNTNNGFLEMIEQQLDDVLLSLYTLEQYVNTENTNLSTIITRLNTIIPYLQDYMPYLSNISTNTNNIYNTLLDFYSYINTMKINLNDFVYPGFVSNNLNIGDDFQISDGYGVYNCLRIPYTSSIYYLIKNQTIGLARTLVVYVDYNNKIIDKWEATATQNITLNWPYNAKYCYINLGMIDSNYITPKFIGYLSIPNVYTQILLLLGRFNEMSAEEESQAQAMSEEYAERASQAGQQAVAMNPAKPTVSASQFDLNNMVDSTQRQTFSGLIGMIVGNSFITKLFLIVLTCAIAGFALYGRKK